MLKISKEGVKIVKSKISTPLETAAEKLIENGNFKDVQPMFQLVFEIIRDIETKWEKVD
tara:strand:+ start:81 stop:257 length:177 start_codon:yes stop_codon:yes gene_type:complete